MLHVIDSSSFKNIQISASLQDAHQWFKSKFENLQTELIHSR